MLLEPKIGKLIRKLNPYTDGSMETMVCGSTPANLAGLGTLISGLGTAISTYAGSTSSANLANVVKADSDLDEAMHISDLHVRVDNDFHQEYMNWTFRGQPQAVKRALRLTYRYELRDRKGAGTGIWVTDHVLIGYCGANG